MNTTWTSPIVIAFILLAVGGYAALFIPTLAGYGYAGYGGYDRGPSVLYFGGAPTFNGPPSVRSGSRGGPLLHGGGMHGGK